MQDPDSSAGRLLHTIGQTADRLQRSPRRIRELIDAKELEVVRDGRSVRVVASSEDAFVLRLRQREAEKHETKVA